MTTTEELRRLLAEATPGPWTFSPRWMHHVIHGQAENAYIVDGEPDGIVRSAFSNDAALIVAAVNALPGLLDEREALRKAARLLIDWIDDGGNAAAWPNASGLSDLRGALARLEGAS